MLTACNPRGDHALVWGAGLNSADVRKARISACRAKSLARRAKRLARKALHPCAQSYLPCTPKLFALRANRKALRTLPTRRAPEKRAPQAGLLNFGGRVSDHVSRVFCGGRLEREAAGHVAAQGIQARTLAQHLQQGVALQRSGHHVAGLGAAGMSARVVASSAFLKMSGHRPKRKQTKQYLTMRK